MAKTLMDSLGIELLEMTEDKVVATMPVDERTHQPFGFYMVVHLLRWRKQQQASVHTI